jgi:hypothetical protein
MVSSYVGSVPIGVIIDAILFGTALLTMAAARFLPEHHDKPRYKKRRVRIGSRCRDAFSQIGSGAGDCAPAPSHTTGRTVFRIQRLDSAAPPGAARSDGIFHQILVHCFRSEGSQSLGLATAALAPPRLHRFEPRRTRDGDRSCHAPCPRVTRPPLQSLL